MDAKRKYRMRKKPREKWHNYDFSNEIDLGELEIAISMNAEVLKKFLEYAQDRVNRNTGIRFKWKGKAAQEIVHKYGGKHLSYQIFSRGTPYIFPNSSQHSNRYDSFWNRVEFYIPVERLERRSEDDQDGLL